MVSLLSDNEIWNGYYNWMNRATEAYAKQLFIIERVTDPNYSRSLKVWQQVATREHELMNDEAIYREMAQPYLDELRFRGMIGESTLP